VNHVRMVAAAIYATGDCAGRTAGGGAADNPPDDTANAASAWILSRKKQKDVPGERLFLRVFSTIRAAVYAMMRMNYYGIYFPLHIPIYRIKESR
jgi:hypothetical protein